MDIHELLNQAEGRRLEFTTDLSDDSDIAKTAVAFANDAGGEIYVGVQDKPRLIIGFPEKELQRIDEQISNLINEKCSPTVFHENSFITVGNKHLIKTRIYKGTTPPYCLKIKNAGNVPKVKVRGRKRKEKEVSEEIYIRAGATNRIADANAIAEFERRSMNISFDRELITESSIYMLNTETLKKMYMDKTRKKLDIVTLYQLNLIKRERETYLTRALILLSDDTLRRVIFPNAKVECVVYKGDNTEEPIEQQTVDCSIIKQMDEAYNFVIRHIGKRNVNGDADAVKQWEYPVNAIREVIYNAVCHRDYSLKEHAIKVSIYSNMIEISSPGVIPPSIDFSAMESRQSDIRNTMIVSIFKLLGIIEQRGNGLKLIAQEMRNYPEIKFCWKETEDALLIQFIKQNV
jgi:predicted HTH transcriptional regulator